jgi:16S rRNA C967 or C1407 C5-methylase (RsmB/RsmF family)
MNSLYLDQMKTLIPDEFEEYLSSFDNPPRRGIRINSLKTDAQELSGLCTFAMEKHPFCDNGYFVESEESLGRSNAYKTGMFYI